MEKLNKIKDKALAFKNGETDLCKLMYLNIDNKFKTDMLDNGKIIMLMVLVN